MEMMDIPVENLLDPGANMPGIDSELPAIGLGSTSLHLDEIYGDAVNGNDAETKFVETIFKHYLTGCFPECLPHINGEGEFISDGIRLAEGKENKEYSGGIYIFSKLPVEELMKKKIISHTNKLPAERYPAMSQITQYFDKTNCRDGIHIITNDDFGCEIVLNSSLFFKDVDVEKYSPYLASEVGVKTTTVIYAATQLGEDNMKTVVIKQTAHGALGFGAMLVFGEDGLEMEAYLKYAPAEEQSPKKRYSVRPEDMVQNIAVVVNMYERIDGRVTCNKTVELPLSGFYNAWGFDISEHCGAKNRPEMGQYSAQFTQVISPQRELGIPVLSLGVVEYTIGPGGSSNNTPSNSHLYI